MKTEVKLIINADDLGLTRGINKAVLRAHKDGILSHASIMTNAAWYQHALHEVVSKCPNLKIGVHLNLTCENSLSNASLLCSDSSQMKNSFVKLLLRRKSREFLQQVEEEFEAQIKAALKSNIEISHLDGHEHIHVIPSFNRIVKKLAAKYQIARIREINENFFTGLVTNRKSVTAENVLKWLLLSFLSLFNENQRKVKFHSIFATCKINKDNFLEALKKNSKAEYLEVMLHPGILEDNGDGSHLEKRFRDFLASPDRFTEYELCLNNELKQYVVAQ